MASALEPTRLVPAPLCTTRAAYRQGRRLTAVKVYSVCSESPHVVVCDVPALRLDQELRALLARHGELQALRDVTPAASDASTAPAFTRAYHAVYDSVRPAVAAKQAIDTLNWYGGSLHVCYAPECESVDETRDKLRARRLVVAARLRRLRNEAREQTHIQSRRLTNLSGYPAADEAAPPPPPPPRPAKRPRLHTVVLAPQHAPCFLPPPATARTGPDPLGRGAGGTLEVRAAPTAGHARPDPLCRGTGGSLEVRAAPSASAAVNRVRFTVRERQLVRRS